MISPRYAADPEDDDIEATEARLFRDSLALLWTLIVGALTILGLLYGAPWAVALVRGWGL